MFFSKAACFCLQLCFPTIGAWIFERCFYKLHPTRRPWPWITAPKGARRINDDGGLYTSSLAAKDHEEVKSSFEAAERGIGAHLCRVRPMSQLGKGQIDVEAVTDPVLIPIADWHRGEPAQVYPNEMGLCMPQHASSRPPRADPASDIGKPCPLENPINSQHGYAPESTTPGRQPTRANSQPAWPVDTNTVYVDDLSCKTGRKIGVTHMDTGGAEYVEANSTVKGPLIGKVGDLLSSCEASKEMSIFRQANEEASKIEAEHGASQRYAPDMSAPLNERVPQKIKKNRAERAQFFVCGTFGHFCHF